MKSPSVRRLYKYAPLNERTLAILLTGRIWYASPANFNDPFDSSVPNAAESMVQSRRSDLGKLLNTGVPKAADPELGNITARLQTTFLKSRLEDARTLAESVRPLVSKLRTAFHSFGVLCLSKDPASILMWSHYAAQHTGVCIGFQRTPHNQLGKQALPVHYTNRRIAGKSAGPLYQKHSGWKYEREWRDIQNEGNALYPLPGKVVEVVCGAKMRVENIELIQTVVAQLNGNGARIRVSHAFMHESRYTLQLESTPTDA